jgi:hypothetical protein
LTDIDIRWVRNSDIQLKNGRLSTPIVDYLEVEGYPSESRSDFKEANISDLVYATIIPIISDFKRQTRCTLRFQREDKEIVSVDSETGDTEAFVLMDLISVANDKFVFVVEAKRSSVGEAMKQLLLATFVRSSFILTHLLATPCYRSITLVMDTFSQGPPPSRSAKWFVIL